MYVKTTCSKNINWATCCLSTGLQGFGRVWNYCFNWGLSVSCGEVRCSVDTWGTPSCTSIYSYLKLPVPHPVPQFISYMALCCFEGLRLV